LVFAAIESGRVRTITGKPPLKVTLGNASAVSVQINDRAVVVPRVASRLSARFVIEADGTVRSGE